MNWRKSYSQLGAASLTLLRRWEINFSFKADWLGFHKIPQMKSYQSADETIDQLGQIMKGKTGKPIYQSSGGKRVDLRDLLLNRQRGSEKS